MKKKFPVLFAAMLCGTLQAQAPTSLATDLKTQYTNIKNNITHAAEEMTDDGYTFQPMPTERNFGGWVAHVADSEARTCSTLAGSPKSVDAAAKTSKADLTAALKAAFDMCDAVYDANTDANINDAVNMGRGGARTRAAILAGDIAHDNECYGSMAVYLRLKEMVPPSSQGRGGRGGAAPKAGDKK